MKDRELITHQTGSLATLNKGGSTLFFNRFQLDEYETNILNNPKATEMDAAHFFSRFPQFLLLGSGTDLRRESVLIGPDGKAIGRVDFFRRGFGNKFWDVIELKGPQLPVIAGIRGNHPRLSSTILEAVNQAQDYRDWIAQDKTVREHLLKKGIRVYRPQTLVVAGKRGDDIPDELLQLLFNRINSSGTSLLSYSDVFNFAKEHYKTHGIITVPAVSPHPKSDLVAPFLGYHRHRLVSGSLLLPKSWQFKSGDEVTLVLWPKSRFGPCVRVLPQREMRELWNAIDAMANNDPNKIVLKRFIASESTAIIVDSRRRIHLPRQMRTACNLFDWAAIVGMNDRFEIWQPARYRRVQVEDEETFRSLLRSGNLRTQISGDQRA